MDKTYTLFNEDGSFDGVISGTYEYMIKPTLAAWKGSSYEGTYDDSYYSHKGELKKRPEFPITVNDLTLENVPAGSAIIIENEEYPVEETTDVYLEFNLPGTYKVLVTCWPYLDKEFEIDYQPQE